MIQEAEGAWTGQVLVTEVETNLKTIKLLPSPKASFWRQQTD